MRQSNGYLIGFTAVLTVVCAMLLAGVYQGLRERTVAAQELDKKAKILGAAMNIQGLSSAEIESKYNSMVEAIVVDRKGNLVEMEAGAVDVYKEYKSGTPKYLPVYKFRSDVDTSKFESYILPVYGNGLWDNIWGYLCLGGDFNTINGAVFDHKAETPGLGARITEPDIQNRFKNKEIFSKDMKLVGVEMQKGEGNNYDGELHQVDGLSGASMTAFGLNDMIKAYLTHYEPYIRSEMKVANASSSSTGAYQIPRNIK